MAKAPKIFRPVIVTANHLRSGAVVYRTRAGTWSLEVAEAEVAGTPEAAETLLARAMGDHAANIVVEPVLIEIVHEGGFVRPASLRELIRASGPTIPLPVPDPV